jgi:hypothetical protein
LAPRPLGSVAVDRHRGSGLAPLPLLRTGGCRPGAGAARVLGSYRPLPVAAALSTCPGPGTGSGSATGSNIPSCCSKTQNAFRPAKAKAKGSWFLYLRIHMPISTVSTVWRLASGVWRLASCQLSDQILCRLLVLISQRLALQRKPGPRIALSAHRLHYPVDIWRRLSVDHTTGLLRRSARCSTWSHSARASMQQRRPQRPPSFLHVRPRALWLECGPVEKKKRPPPSRQSHVAGCLGCLHAGGEQRGHLAALGRQAK